MRNAVHVGVTPKGNHHGPTTTITQPGRPNATDVYLRMQKSPGMERLPILRRALEQAYEAGAASKNAEIDELENRLYDATER